jgi:nucleoside-diphosphate-sugar epimerase
VTLSRAVVVGGSGFIGRHLVTHLHGRGTNVLQLVRKPKNDMAGPVEILGPLHWSQQEIERVLRAFMPEVLFHVAGIRQGHSLLDLYEANVFLAERLMAGAAAAVPHCRIVVVGSAAEYGLSARPGEASREDDLCRPLGAYGISKHAQTLHALARARLGQPITVARLFNPIGAGMAAGQALADFAEQIASQKPVIESGDLDIARDFMNVTDAVRMMAELVERPEAIGKVFNICSGQAVTLRSALQKLIKISGRDIGIQSTRQPKVDDIPASFGSAERIRSLGIREANADLMDPLRDLLQEVTDRFDS